jgi:uncharacterized membrane protein
MVVLLLFCSTIYATEANIRLIGHFQRDIKSNDKTAFSIYFENNGNDTLYNLELTALNDDNLDIMFDMVRINRIEPKEQLQINVEINNDKKYYFDTDTFITYKISNNEYSNVFRYRYTIKPVENFWFFTILSISLLLIILFIVLFIKLDKGEKNVG